MEVQETVPNNSGQQPSLSADEQQAELDKLMNQYNVPAKSLIDLPTSAPVSEPVISAKVDTTTVPDKDAPFGRYQRGKLKGQPRSTPYISQKTGLSSAPPMVAPGPVEPPKLTGMLISGGLFLMLVNLCLPLFFAVVNNFFSKDKLNPDNLKLTKEQIKELDPVCDAAMKQASVTGNPVLLLILGICTAMGMNYMMWKMKNDSKPKLPTNETQKSNN